MEISVCNTYSMSGEIKELKKNTKKNTGKVAFKLA